jgi:hypothetical protein
VADLSPLSDPEIRADALRFCLAICEIAYSDDAEERDELAREAELAHLDLERLAAARELSCDALGIFFLRSLEIYRLGIEAGIAMTHHGPQ